MVWPIGKMQEKKSSFQCKANRKRQRNTRIGNGMDYRLFGLKIGWGRPIENVSHKKEATQLKTLKVIAKFFSYSLVTLGLLLQVFMDRAVKIDHMLVMETVKNLPTYFPITDESCSAQST